MIDDVEFDDLLPQPDLTIENLQASVGLDRQLVITADVRNIGKGPSSPTTFELSEPDLWDTAPSVEVPGVEPGKHASVNLLTLVPPTTRSSAYSYRVVVDPKQTIGDIDPRNNSKRDRFVISSGKPDLSVRILSTGITSDENAFVVVKIRNTGNAPSTPTQVNIDWNGQTIGSASVEPLQPSGSVDLNFQLARNPGPGTHPLQAIVNPDKTQDETDLTNNSAPGSISIPAIWWRRPEVIFGAGALLVATGLWLTYKLVKGRPSPNGNQEPGQPDLPVPNFGARPIFDGGNQELTLNPGNVGPRAWGSHLHW